MSIRTRTSGIMVDINVTPVAAGYQGAGDIVAGALYYGGLRGYTAAYAASGSNPGIVSKDSGTNNPTTINIKNTGFLDFVTLNGLISGDPSQYLFTLTDQSGNANDITYHFASSSPQFLTNALGSFTTIYWPSTGRHGSGTNPIVQAQPYTIVFVGYRETGGVSDIADLQPASISTDTISADGGITNLSASPVSSDNTWYAIIGVFNGGSSIVSLNGTETTGNANTNGLNNQMILGQAFGSDATKFRLMEIGVWSAGFTPTQRTNMINNIRSTWGF